MCMASSYKILIRFSEYIYCSDSIEKNYPRETSRVDDHEELCQLLYLSTSVDVTIIIIGNRGYFPNSIIAHESISSIAALHK